jgi:hypothetical protein
MKCDDFESRLNDVLDERRAPAVDALLAEHAGHCVPCRGLLRDYEALAEGAGSLSAPCLEDGFSHRAVAAALDQVQTHSPASPLQGNWWTLAGLAAVAAALLLAVVLSWPEPDDRGIAGPTPQPSAPGDDGGSPPVPDRKRPSHSPDSQPLPIERLAMFPRGDYGRHSTVALGNLAARFPEAALQLDEMERYAPGIRPIKASFTLLLDALWHTIPGLTSPPEESNTTSWQRQSALLS